MRDRLAPAPPPTNAINAGPYLHHSALVTTNNPLLSQPSAGLQLEQSGLNCGPRERNQGCDEEDPGRVSAGEREFVDGDDGGHGRVVVGRALAAEDGFGEADDSEVEEEAEEHRTEEREECRGEWGEEEGKADWEGESKIEGVLEEEKVRHWKIGVEEARGCGRRIENSADFFLM
ncbi:unnamed protein product [Linum trigynum]|uniref:Uncharacterized protein n=1 Tax=Linum trigynum TaxID=586398 RepID=A0AAV2EEJ3_9ROSI